MIISISVDSDSYKFNLHLLSLERFEDVKRDYRDKIEEMENTASRLKMQLKSAQAELEQTRTALKALQGSDGNGNYGLNFHKSHSLVSFPRAFL